MSQAVSPLLGESGRKPWQAALADRMLVKLHATGHRVLLFSTMTRLLDLLEVRFSVVQCTWAGFLG